MPHTSQVNFASSSEIVQVHLPDGRVLQGSRGALAEEFIKPIQDTLPAPAVGVILNGQLHELTYPVQMEAQLVPVTMADNDGARRAGPRGLRGIHALSLAQVHGWQLAPEVFGVAGAAAPLKEGVG